MSLRDAYQEKLEAQLEEQKAKLALLKARAKRAAADGKIIAYEEIADAEQKLGRMTGKLKDFSKASGDAWKEMKTGVDQAWKDLQASCRKAAASFRDKETNPPTPSAS